MEWLFRRNGVAVPAQRGGRSGATGWPFRRNGVAVPARRGGCSGATGWPFRRDGVAVPAQRGGCSGATGWLFRRNGGGRSGETGWLFRRDGGDRSGATGTVGAAEQDESPLDGPLCNLKHLLSASVLVFSPHWFDSGPVEEFYLPRGMSPGRASFHRQRHVRGKAPPPPACVLVWDHASRPGGSAASSVSTPRRFGFRVGSPASPS